MDRVATLLAVITIGCHAAPPTHGTPPRPATPAPPAPVAAEVPVAAEATATHVPAPPAAEAPVVRVMSPKRRVPEGTMCGHEEVRGCDCHGKHPDGTCGDP